MTIFAKIINREIPADIVYEDEHCLAFKDISPQAPMHVLLIPKQPIAKLTDTNHEHKELLGHMMITASEVAKQQGYDEFRVVINNGAGVGQTVFHLHMHLLAGRGFHWPPG
jgi:histidine triad (HIT) family protein